MDTPDSRRAVVVGASIGGLCAARALAEHFDEVIVVDRDDLPDGPDPRKGAPQGNHGHVLLGAGQQALEDLFPGLRAELVGLGATEFDPGRDMLVVRGGKQWPLAPLGLRLLSLSRPLLEHTIRARVGALPNVSVRTGVAVSGLTGDARRVTGVSCDPGGELPAALVVDATGRGSRSDRWLSALGCPVPQVSEIVNGVGYASRLLRRNGELGDLIAAFVLPSPPEETLAGLVVPIEGDRWLVSLGAWHGGVPVDEDTFAAHAAALPSPRVAQVLADAAPLTPIHVHRLPSNRRRHFENLTAAPAGYVAIGDAICSFNPIYGQGMTCAALEALALRRLLRRHGTAATARFVRAYHKAAAGLLKTPWSFAAGGDLRWPQTTGPRSGGNRLLNGYTARVLSASVTDNEVRRVFTAVQHLLLPPAALLRPSVVRRVLRATRTPAPQP